jgi:hypothetical protein
MSYLDERGERLVLGASPHADQRADRDVDVPPPEGSLRIRVLT